MISVVSSEKKFIESLPSLTPNHVCHLLKYGVHPSELTQLLDGQQNSATPEQRFLSGLLQTKQVFACQTNGNRNIANYQSAALSSDRIERALSCNRIFLHNLNLSDSDIQELEKHGIKHNTNDRCDYLDLLGRKNERIVSSWSLKDGNNEKLSDHALMYLEYAQHIKIYDRYFTAHSLQSLEELISSANQAFGSINFQISIYCGAGPKGIEKNDIVNTLSSLLPNANQIHVAETDKIQPHLLHLHDRHMQIDDDYTFDFTSGIGCYCEMAGTNRASTVNLKHLHPEYEKFEILDKTTQSAVEIRY